MKENFPQVGLLSGVPYLLTAILSTAELTIGLRVVIGKFRNKFPPRKL